MKLLIENERLIDGSNKKLKITNLKKINVIFGKNGTGKSSFLRNLYRSNTDEFHLVVPERGGADMSYQPGILTQEYDVTQKKRARERNFDSNYRNRAISRATGILTTTGFNTLHGIDHSVIDAQQISNLFHVLLPTFEVKFNPNPPYNIEIYRYPGDDQNKINSAVELSSGETEALSLASDIITQAISWNKSEKTLLIDEPDSHLHVDLENRFAIFINEIASQFDIQIIIATHSSGLIASLLSSCDEVGIVCFDKRSNEIATVKKDEAAIFTNLLSIELSLAVILKRKIVIVDGNDDFLVWNQATRSHTFNDIAIIQANGSDILKYKKNAEKILESVLDFPDKCGVTIFDGDGKNEFTNEGISILPGERLNCYSLENLFLTNEVLEKVRDQIDLNSELNSLLESEIPTEEEKKQIRKIIEDKQQARISKTLIKKIHSRLDNHITSRDWRILLGKTLGSQKPNGELAKFLGDGIVSYIWENN